VLLPQTLPFVVRTAASLLSQVGRSTTSYKDTATRRGTTYTYTVAAVNLVGEGQSSNPATIAAR